MSKRLRKSAATPGEHLVCLHRMQLAGDIARNVDAAWSDYFVPLDASLGKGPSGEFGQVMLVRATPSADDGSRVRAQQTYALKLLFKPPESDERERLALLLELHHWAPKVAQYPRSLLRYVAGYRFLSDGQRVDAILLDAVRGQSLERLIREPRATVPLDQWLFWMVDVLRALEYLHALGIAHRDVKSGNVMVRDNGAEAVLIDLDLMCLPSSKFDECRTLCSTGKRSLMAVSPDVVCTGIAGSPYPSSAQQYYRMDVWSCASTFVSYLAHLVAFLPMRLHYDRKQRKWRQCPLHQSMDEADKTINIALMQTFIESERYGSTVPESVRLLLASMLQSQWQSRPSATECLRRIGAINGKLLTLRSAAERSDYLQQRNGIAPREALQQRRELAPTPPLTPEQEAAYVDSDFEPYDVK